LDDSIGGIEVEIIKLKERVKKLEETLMPLPLLSSPFVIFGITTLVAKIKGSSILLIQVDIGGHPPFPTRSKHFSGNGNFEGLNGNGNGNGHFEGLNEGFLGSRFSMISKGSNLSPKLNILEDTFPTGYHVPKPKIVCKRYDPGKLMY
jgi:hypothetical protein